MTPENDAKKTYLKRYRKDIVELEQCKQEVIQLRLKALPGGISYDGMPHGCRVASPTMECLMALERIMLTLPIMQ